MEALRDHRYTIPGATFLVFAGLSLASGGDLPDLLKGSEVASLVALLLTLIFGGLAGGFIIGQRL